MGIIELLLLSVGLGMDAFAISVCKGISMKKMDWKKARTLEEVGKEFDVTRERIRQIEAKALRKLRHPSRSKKLRDYMN